MDRRERKGENKAGWFMQINGSYLVPSKKKRFLDLMHIVHHNRGISQHNISKKMNVSSAIVNKYLSDLVQAKNLEIKKLSSRRFEYHLSEKGQCLFRKMTLEYHAELVRHYTDIKNSITRNIKDELRDYHQIGIFGADETGGLVSNVVSALGKKIICAFDNDTGKQSETFMGLRVFPPQEIFRIRPQAVVITSIAGQEEIYNQLVDMIGEEPIKVIRTVL
jgi:predicted transcriptional regulator